MLTTALPLTAADLPKGLILHLDASDAGSLVMEQGKIASWQDLSGHGNHAALITAAGPMSVPKALSDRAVLRFSGKEQFAVERLADGIGGISAFVVFRRTAEQATPRKWQRLLSCWNGKTPNDTQAGSFFVDTGTEGSAQAASVRVGIFPGSTHRGRLLIGRNMTKPGEELIGDVAEIMVFNHSFLVYEQIQAVKDYLMGRWGIVEERSDWTRTGPLPELPKHTSTDYPLSDQTNESNWQKIEAFCDDFEGDRLNDAVWWNCNPGWYGRAPSRFLPENVAVRDGQLHLTFRRDDDLPTEVLYKSNGAEYNTYSSASVVSKALFRYGYFEIKARPMDSAGSSAFWLSGGSFTEKGRYGLEIDVFEIGGKAKGYEYNYGMNAHVFETPEDGKKHWNKGGKWVAPFRLADGFHVYGLEWGEAAINYYFDGILVRSLPNTHWHGPMFLLFDSEAMFNWLGVPEDEDLPSTFSIDYCRVWTNPEMDTDWRKTYRPHREPTVPTKISDYARDFRKKHPKTLQGRGE